MLFCFEKSFSTHHFPIIKTNKKCSISWLQRQLGIGYNRAANIVEQLEKDKIIENARVFINIMPYTKTYQTTYIVCHM